MLYIITKSYTDMYYTFIINFLIAI